jgi:hypothetical protein
MMLTSIRLLPMPIKLPIRPAAPNMPATDRAASGFRGATPTGAAIAAVRDREIDSRWEGIRVTGLEGLAVAETLYRYALGIDTRDWALYRSIFAPEVEIDFSSYSDQPAASMTADAWLASIRPLFTGLAATQHCMTNPLPVVDGAEASCRMYVRAHHVFEPDDPASWFTIGGFYDDRLVRDGSAWRIRAVRLTVLWRMGDPAIMEAATRLGQSRLDEGSA